MFRFLIEKRMTLMSLLSVYFMQFWVATSFYRQYPGHLYMATYCTNMSAGGDLEAYFFSLMPFYITLPSIIFICIVLGISRDIGINNKWKWFLMSIVVEIFMCIGVILVNPLPS